MEEALQDLEFEEAVNKWRKHYGQTIKPSLIDASLTAGAHVDDTTIDVSTYNGFPSTPFRIQVGNEVMQVTRVGGHTLDVIRGTEGTVAMSHYAGDAIYTRF